MPAELTLVQLTPADAALGVALSQSVGWQNPLSTWKRLLVWGKQGNFALSDGEKLVASAMSICYGHDRAWINMVVTHPDYQRQGLALYLMEVLLDHLHHQGIREICLDASSKGLPLYQRLGFRALGEIGMWESTIPQAESARMPPLTFSMLPKAIAFDAAVFGVARAQVLSRYLEEFPDLVWIDRDAKSQQIKGMIWGREDTPQSGHIGMWEHHDPAGAEALFRTALASLAQPGRKISMQIPAANTTAQAIVSKYGFTTSRFCTRMVLGEVMPAPGDPSAYYAIGGFAFG